MIVQQTLTRREKIFATFAVLFLVSLVGFGYIKTVASPMQASVLHATAMEKKHIEHFEELRTEFDGLREGIGFIQSLSIKAKIRTIKICFADAQQNKTNSSYDDCEKLIVEAQNAIDSLDEAMSNLESQVQSLEKKVNDYGVVVEEALGALQKKEGATVKSAGH